MEVAKQDLVSQGMDLGLPDSGQEENASKTSYISSVTSLTLRLPAFDHVNMHGKAYLKIKSKECIYVTNKAAAQQQD